MRKSRISFLEQNWNKHQIREPEREDGTVETEEYETISAEIAWEWAISALLFNRAMC